MDHAQDCIAVDLRVRDNTYPREIIYLLKGDLLGRHLQVYAVKMLCPAANLCLKSIDLQILLYNFYDLADVFFPFSPFHRHLPGEIAVYLRFQILEGQVFKLYLHPPDSEAVCNRGIYLHGLLCNPLLFLRRKRFQRPHVVESVCKFYQDDPDILAHGDNHLPEILGLLLLPRHKLHFADLRQPLHQI